MSGSNPTTAETSLSVPLPEPTGLAIELRLSAQGPVAARETVAAGDLGDAFAEARWRTGACRGFLDTPPEELGVKVSPSFHSDDPKRCVGFRIHSQDPSGSPCSSPFDFDCLEPVASRMAARLIKDGTLQAGESYFYSITTTNDLPKTPDEPKASQIQFSSRSSGLSHVICELAPLLEQARSVDHRENDPRHPVIYTKEARQSAERIARKGGDVRPPVEKGGVLIGYFGLCPVSRRIFVVVTDALEATDAAEKEFSLSFSSRTWARIQGIMNARREDPLTAAHRLLGQFHSHPFLPDNGAPPCEACATAKVCGRNTAFLSAADHLWCRAVFAGQPWQIGHVFGLNARGDDTEAFFGQFRGRLRPRGYHVISGSALSEITMKSPSVSLPESDSTGGPA